MIILEDTFFDNAIPLVAATENTRDNADTINTMLRNENDNTEEFSIFFNNLDN